MTNGKPKLSTTRRVAVVSGGLAAVLFLPVGIAELIAGNVTKGAGFVLSGVGVGLLALALARDRAVVGRVAGASLVAGGGLLIYEWFAHGL
jgi:hypothetical protein